MSTTLRGISSMATRHVLGALAAAYTERTGVQVQVESVGGVDAAQRVANGEVFDWVALGEGAMQGLMEQGYLVANSLVPVVASPTAVAVAEDAAVPSIETEDTLRATVREAATLGYATGPSGKALAALFERWGLTQELSTKLVVPPPGVPVAQWVAQGRIALGFQQRSELLGVPGVQVVGDLPAAVAITTIFSAATASTSSQPEAVQAWLQFLTQPIHDDLLQQHGMRRVDQE